MVSDDRFIIIPSAVLPYFRCKRLWQLTCYHSYYVMLPFNIETVGLTHNKRSYMPLEDKSLFEKVCQHMQKDQ